MTWLNAKKEKMQQFQDVPSSFVDIVQGSVLCLSVPSMFEFGIDNCSHQLASQDFRGINQITFNIPHIIYYNRIDHDKFGSGQGPRICFFHVFTRENPFLVLDYDEKDEDFVLIPPSDDRFGRAVSQYQAGLWMKQIAPYSDEMKKNWQNLVSFIDCSFLEKIEPIHKKITSTLYEEEVMPSSSTGDRIKKANTIYYIHIPQKLSRKGLTPEQITKLNFDKSQLLEEIIDAKKNASYKTSFHELFAEIQFSFICLLHGQCLHGLSQWKKLVHLFCNCEDALIDRTDMFLSFIELIRYQFEMLPRDFIEDMVEHDFDLDEEKLLQVTKRDHTSGLDRTDASIHHQAKTQSKITKRDHFLQKTLLQLFLTVDAIDEDEDEKPILWALFSKTTRKFKQYLEREFEGCKDMFIEDEEDIPKYVR